jgi:hypothetical protein
MESSKSQQSTRERISGDLQKALDDLRRAGESASGEVRSGIESAVTRIRNASSSATPDDLRAQLDSFTDWLQSATADVLDEVEKEVRKRRRQLRGQGGSRSSGAAKSGGAGSRKGSPSGSKKGSSGSKKGSSGSKS